MSGRLIAREDDIVGRSDEPITITLDGVQLSGIAGQTLGGLLLSGGVTSWRYGPDGRPRGLFCGIGACFDCVATVNGQADVRLCRRRAVDGDIIATQRRGAP